MGIKQIESKIAQANNRLSNANMGIKIYRRGDRLKHELRSLCQLYNLSIDND